jgi:repressor of nif and glnA expression
MTTFETRRESNESIDREKRYEQILNILKGKTMTAKEVAVEMNRRGFVPTSERNFAAPRLTELVKRGMVNVVGKKTCEYTSKKVAQYQLA